MINFFRHFRQQQISENKTGKYLRYAIGEIVLVVIGILIALQINNWNEQRKIKQKETVILKAFLSSINSDLNAYNYFSDPKIETKKRGLDSLFTYIFNKKEINDSLFLVFYNNMSQDIFVKFDNGPFEDLKSSGLDIIGNDILRTAINNTYTVKLPLYSYVSNTLYEESKPEISKLERRFLNLHPARQKDGSNILKFNLQDVEVLNNQDFLWILDIEQKKYHEYNLQLNQIRSTLIQLKSDIEKELKP